MKPVETVLAALDAAGCAPRKTARGWQAKCPAHDDRNPSLSIEEGDGGRVLLRCFAGCEALKVVEALKLTWQHLFPDGTPYREAGAARRRPRQASRPGLAPRPEPPPPVPDRERLARLVEHGIGNLDKPETAQFLNKRGFTAELCARYCVGFMPWLRFTGWKRALPNVWTIPISDAVGRVLAVKLHRERPPEGCPKGLWAPFGTEPPDKPRHGWPSLWPAPETFGKSDVLYLLPGELKALAVLGTGRAATSPTAGEAGRWTPGLLARLAGRPIVIVFDDDDAGRRWRDATLAALKPLAVSLRAVSFGTDAPHKDKSL